MSAGENNVGNRWADAWPDALAFAGGLALAWFGHWDTKDLVWSLWLSSLVVGYAMIVWSIFGPAVFIGTKAWGDRAMLQETPKGPLVAGGSVLLIGGLFLLAFFTVHFGMFHFVHSVFLNAFFPVVAGVRGPSGALYGQVLTTYWPFVLVAAVAERQAFRLQPKPEETPDTSVKAEAIAARKARKAMKGGMTGMMAPYRNVIRLHLLIFFFAFASFAQLDSFLVYTVVYAVYFFPWRLVGREKAAG
ncbi:MAG: DUF6498-containing protein [Lacunisphaera sp.]|nr:DUF6498-containing protein [Lacunisphaera sp.]